MAVAPDPSPLTQHLRLKAMPSFQRDIFEEEEARGAEGPVRAFPARQAGQWRVLAPPLVKSIGVDDAGLASTGTKTKLWMLYVDFYLFLLKMNYAIFKIHKEV